MRLTRLLSLCIAAVVAALVLIGVVQAVGSAHTTSKNVARYGQATGPAYMPQRLVLRCEHGWAEDTADHIRLVEFSRDRVVYRCAADF